MKKVFFLAIALIAIFVSCSSDSDTKKITPTSTEFTSGELARYIKVVDTPSELTYTEKEGNIATQYIRLKVTMELVKDGIKDVDARDIDFHGLLSVAVINLVDETGITVQELNIKSEELLKLKKLLTGDKGSTEEIIFEGEFHNSDDAPNWFKDATQFTPYLTGDISIESSSDTSENEISGDMDDYADQDENGAFEWLSERKLTISDLEGLSSSELRIMRNSIYARHGRLFKSPDLREYFNAQSWYNGYRDEVPESEMNANEKYNIQFIKSHEDGGSAGNISYDSSNFDTGGGDPSVDEFIDEYEKFWRKYMSFIKKMDKNNPAAMTEYAQLMVQYQEYANKLQKMKGKVSIDQLNRINKMNAELLSEMEKVKKP